jgi:hypothetical protein
MLLGLAALVCSAPAPVEAKKIPLSWYGAVW